MRTFLLTMVAGLSLACFDSDDDGRLPLAEVECDEAGCMARWAGTDGWSTVFDVEDMPTDVDPSTLWDCEPDPDVDGCGIIDQNGHVACWREQDQWAVVVAPLCALEGEGWLPVGNGMVALTH